MTKKLAFLIGILLGVGASMTLVYSTTCGGFFCDVDIPLRRVPAQFKLEKYSTSEEYISDLVITRGESVYEKLELVLEQERNGWRSNIVSWGHGRFVFRSEGVSMHCFDDFMVVDMLYSGRHVSFEKRIPNLLQRLGLLEVTPDKKE